MAIRLGDEAPNFTADTTMGQLSFHEWKGNSWAVLFSHPKDFTRSAPLSLAEPRSSRESSRNAMRRSSA